MVDTSYLHVAIDETNMLHCVKCLCFTGGGGDFFSLQIVHGGKLLQHFSSTKPRKWSIFLKVIGRKITTPHVSEVVYIAEGLASPPMWRMILCHIQLDLSPLPWEDEWRKLPKDRALGANGRKRPKEKRLMEIDFALSAVWRQIGPWGRSRGQLGSWHGNREQYRKGEGSIKVPS